MAVQHINGQMMKTINRQNILNTIRKNEPISRSELVKKTGLTNGTVTNLIAELLQMNLLVETGSAESQGGRRPVLLELNAAAGYAVGLELQATHITCVVSDFKASILQRGRQRIQDVRDQARVIDQLVSLVEQTLRAAGVQRRQVFGLGLAIPGPCDHRQGLMINPPNFPGWYNVPVKAILEQRLGLRVYVGKETSCAAFSEYWFGQAAGVSRVFGLLVGEVGIGGALIFHGRIYRPQEEEAMDVGHTTVVIDGRPCACGSCGCLEAYADGQALIRYVRQAAERDGVPFAGTPDFDGILRGIKQKDPRCLAAADQCAFYIGAALKNVVSLLAPEYICVGGEFVERCPYLYEKIMEELDRHLPAEAARRIVRQPFTFGKLSGAVGGLALVFEQLSETQG